MTPAVTDPEMQNSILQGHGGGGKKGGGKNADDTMRSIAHAVLIDAISEGPIVGLVDGSNSIYVNQTPLSNIKNSTYQFRHGHPDDEPVEDIEGTEAYQSVGVEVSQVLGDQIRTVLDTDLDTVRIYIALTHLYHVDKKGRMKTANTGWNIDVRPAGGSWRRAVNGRLISEKCTSPIQFQHNINIKNFGDGPWDIRVTAQYPDRVGGKIYEGIQWEGMSLVTKGRFTYPHTALAALNLSAEHVGSSVPRRHYHIRGRLVQVPSNYDPETRAYTGVWDGTFKRAWTNNPAWVYYDIATSRIFGLGNELNEYVTNKWQLYGIAQHCDALVPSGYKNEAGAEILEPRYTFNGAITDKKDAIDALRSITAVWRGMGFYSASQFHVTADTPQDVAHIYGPANVIDGRFEYQSSSAKSRHSVIMVRFNDANNFFESAIEAVIDNDSVHKLGWREKSVELIGCSSRSLARRYGKWIIDTEKNETETVTFSVGMDSIHALPGEVIAINDPRRAQVRCSGRIVETYLGRHVRLDQGLDEAVSRTGAILRVQGADGSLESFTGCTISEDGEWVDVGSGNASDDLIGRVFVLSAQNVAPKEYRIVSIDEQSDGATYQITALEFDRTKFARVEQGISFEPLPERVDLSVVHPVQNLNMTARNYTDGGAIRTDIELGWVSPVDTLVREYRVFVDTPSARSVPVAVTTLNSSSYSASEPGLYTFHIHTVNFAGRVSDPASIEYMVTGAAALGVGRVEDLVNAVTGSATGGFTGADLHLRWRNMIQVSDDPDVPLVEDDAAIYAGTLISIYAGSTLLREQRVTGSTYTYSIEMNRADSLAAGFASARRSLRVEASIVGHDGAQSPVTTISMSNPAPAAITAGVAVSGSSIILNFPEQVDTDYSGTLVWISENSGFTPSSENLVFSGTGGSFTYAGKMSHTYYIRVAGYDAFGREDLNISGEIPVSISIGYDGDAPATPTELLLTTGMSDGNPWVRAVWDGGSEPDFSHFELSIREGWGGSPVFSSTTESEQVFSIGLKSNREYFVAVRAVDFTGNRSTYTAEASILSAVDDVAPDVPANPKLTSGFNTIWVEWDRNIESDLDYYEVAAGDETDPTTIVARTPATSHVLTELPDNATRYVRIRAVDTSGNVSAWTSSLSKTTSVFPEVGVADYSITPQKLVTGEVITLSAQLRDAIITNAKIVELSAAKLMAGTALASTITVNGTALGQMTDPAGLVNTGTTQIDPGKIRITGSTTLADWRKGGDETRIDGGAISANTIDSNKATIGMRGVTLTGIQFEHNSPAANQVSWTEGSLRYINDSNSPVAQAIAAGSATWTAGTLFIYWVKGASTFSTTTNLAVAMTANTVILASYAGDTNLNAEYGRTVIDEDGIKTGAVKAHHIEVEELAAVSGRMGVLEVNNRLTITDSGALLSFKTGPYDEGDGLFFGQTGSDGFALAAARTTPSGVRQSVELRDTGFSLLNARHAVSASISPPTAVASTSQTISLPTAGSRSLSLVIVGAGGSGRGYNRSNGTFSNGNDGGDTIVSLRDGSVIIQTWTASGGKGGKVGNTWTASAGQSSLLGSGGAPGYMHHWRSGPESYTDYYNGFGGSLGAGGGCGYNGTANAVAPPGGMAGQGIVIEKYDISDLTNPNLVVSTGLGGARVGESSRGGLSGAGGSGAVSYTVHIGEDIPADVVPLKPTAWGSFVSAATGTFPDLGSGLWTLHMNTSTAGLGLGYVTTSPGLEIRIHEANSFSFVSSQTPTWRSAAARTVHYLFYKMGSWA